MLASNGIKVRRLSNVGATGPPVGIEGVREGRIGQPLIKIKKLPEEKFHSSSSQQPTVPALSTQGYADYAATRGSRLRLKRRRHARSAVETNSREKH
jgi:hypothetical protein